MVLAAYSAAVHPMGMCSGVERLSDSHYLVLVLRLLVDKQGRVVQGEVGGTRGEPNDRWVRFRGVDGLSGAVQDWLSADEGPW